MKTIMLLTFAVGSMSAQQPPPTAPPQTPPPCIAVKNIGSHALRNVLLGGVAGALISKEQYQVLRTINYPAAAIGSKMHGNDLETIQKAGTKVVIMPKRYTADDLVKSCAQ